jgi:hypothetical protein
MQASDTAYPRFKTSFNAGELERWYTPTLEEYAHCAMAVRGQATRFGFLLTLKTFQRLGYFVTSDQIPDAIICHLAEIEGTPVDRDALVHYPSVLLRHTSTNHTSKKMYSHFRSQTFIQTFFFLAVALRPNAGHDLILEGF